MSDSPSSVDLGPGNPLSKAENLHLLLEKQWMSCNEFMQSEPETWLQPGEILGIRSTVYGYMGRPTWPPVHVPVTPKESVKWKLNMTMQPAAARKYVEDDGSVDGPEPFHAYDYVLYLGTFLDTSRKKQLHMLRIKFEHHTIAHSRLPHKHQSTYTTAIVKDISALLESSSSVFRLDRCAVDQTTRDVFTSDKSCDLYEAAMRHHGAREWKRFASKTDQDEATSLTFLMDFLESNRFLVVSDDSADHGVSQQAERLETVKSIATTLGKGATVALGTLIGGRLGFALVSGYWLRREIARRSK